MFQVPLTFNLAEDPILCFDEYDSLSTSKKKKFHSRLSKLIGTKLHEQDPKTSRSVLRQSRDPSKVSRFRTPYILPGKLLFSEYVHLKQSMLCIDSNNEQCTFVVFENQFGNGSFGRAINSKYKVIYNYKANTVNILAKENVIKIIKDSSPEEVLNEKNIGNLARGDGTFKLIVRKHHDKSKYYLIMPRYPGDSLDNIDTTRLSSDERFILIYEILEDLLNIQKKGIIHADLKPNNMVYDPLNDRIRIIDWGLSNTTQLPPKGCGTELYAAPESNMLLTTQKSPAHSFKSDIWSVAFTALQIIACNNVNLLTWNVRTNQSKKINLSTISETYRNDLFSGFKADLDIHENHLNKNLLTLQSQLKKSCKDSKYYKDVSREIEAIKYELENLNQLRRKFLALETHNLTVPNTPFVFPNFDSLEQEIGSFFAGRFLLLAQLLNRFLLIPKLLEGLKKTSFDLPDELQTDIENFKNKFSSALDDDPNQRPELTDLVDSLKPIYEHCYLRSRYTNLYRGVSEMSELINSYQLSERRQKAYAKENDNHSTLLKKKEFYDGIRQSLAVQQQKLREAIIAKSFSQEDYETQSSAFNVEMNKLKTDVLVSEHSSRFWRIMDYVARPFARIFGYTHSLREHVIKTDGVEKVARPAEKVYSSLKYIQDSQAMFANACTDRMPSEDRGVKSRVPSCR